MKLLILKTNSFLSPEAIENVHRALDQAIINGVLILDGNFTYEMVEIELAKVEAPNFQPPEEIKRVDE